MAVAGEDEPTPQQGSLPRWIIIIDVVIVFLLIAFLIFTVFALPNPTTAQASTVRILTAVLFGALGACLTGTAVLKYSASIGKGAKFAISAAAGFALLIIAYLIQPYWY